VVRFTLYDVGIYPREVRVRTGWIAISIEDLSGGRSGVMVERISSDSLNNHGAPQSMGIVNRDSQSWRGRHEMQLEPGSYYVYPVEHSDARAVLIVEP
jgi:hypothetical protein